MVKSVDGKRTYSTRLRQEQAQITKDRILDAASRLFVDRGYSSVTVEDIAREAGVAYQTVYAVFRTKLAVAQAIIWSSFQTEGIDGLMAQARESGDLEVRLRIGARMTRRLNERFRDDRAFHARVRRPGTPGRISKDRRSPARADTHCDVLSTDDGTVTTRHVPRRCREQYLGDDGHRPVQPACLWTAMDASSLRRVAQGRAGEHAPSTLEHIGDAMSTTSFLNAEAEVFATYSLKPRVRQLQLQKPRISLRVTEVGDGEPTLFLHGFSLCPCIGLPSLRNFRRCAASPSTCRATAARTALTIGALTCAAGSRTC